MQKSTHFFCIPKVLRLKHSAWRKPSSTPIPLLKNQINLKKKLFTGKFPELFLNYLTKKKNLAQRGKTSKTPWELTLHGLFRLVF